MIERIDNLLQDWRLDWMNYGEFLGIRYKLTKMRERLFAGEELQNGQGKYIHQVEKHIQNINPHKKIGTIDGEANQEYWVITKD
jgi:hypothetical protein